MANYGIFPTADADFNIYINNANTYLNTAAVKARLVTTPTAVGSLTQVSAWITTAATGWNALYPQSQNPNLTSEASKIIDVTTKTGSKHKKISSLQSYKDF